MKKILGVSFAAMLAVSPMLANAAVTATSAQIAAANTDVTANTNVATTSYVKGAYKAMATEVNKVQADVANVISDINVTTEVEGGVVKSTNSVASNLTALDAAVKNAASSASTTYQLQQNSNVQSTGEGDLHYITAGTGVATNLKALDDQVAANAGAISAEASRAAGVEGTLTSLTTDAQTNLVAAINEVDANADAAAGAAAAAASAASAAQADADALEGIVGNTGMTTTAQTVTGAINELNTAISNANTAGATKEGVVATINHSTASGTVTVYNTWGDETASGQDSVTIASTVAAPATNAYYATIGAQSGTTQTDTTQTGTPQTDTPVEP